MTEEIYEPLVSIIMPAYGSEKVIAETIDSVISQTYKNWELLITNDCSPDNLEDVVNQYLETEKRIKLLCAAKNGGPALARNHSLSHAQGDFVAFLDSDDLWASDKLEKQVKFMLDNQYTFTYTDYRRITIDGEDYPFVNECPDIIDYRFLLTNTSIATLTVMLDKRNLPEIKMKDGWGYDDYVLWLDILRTGVKAYRLPECLAKYRVMEVSVSSKKGRALKWVWNIHRKYQGLNLFKAFYYTLCYSLNAYKRRQKYFN